MYAKSETQCRKVTIRPIEPQAEIEMYVLSEKFVRAKILPTRNLDSIDDSE